MKKRLRAVGGLFAAAMLLGIGWACAPSQNGGPFVTKAEFDAYKEAIAADGAEIEAWAKHTQDWIVAMVQWAGQQHPGGGPPAPPSPPPCDNPTSCPWGTE